MKKKKSSNTDKWLHWQQDRTWLMHVYRKEELPPLFIF